MTALEKAEELFGKYATYAVMWTGGIEVEKQNCKKCALIAVDEIIDSHGWQYLKEGLDYWQEVRGILEKQLK